MNTSEPLMIANALVLGFRHAIDWDHVAALMDITASSTLVTSEGAVALDLRRKHALWLSCLYGLGHCSIVVLIGMALCYFAGFMPDWLGEVIERCVGFTLLAFGIVVGYISLRVAQTGAPSIPISRARLLSVALSRAWHFIRRKPAFESDVVASAQSQFAYGEPTAFGLGVIHGAGVESASQVLLLAAIGASANRMFALSVLGYFSVGFLVSIMLIAYLSVKGLGYTAKFRPLYLLSGFLTATVSITVGIILLSGQSAALPVMSGTLK
jgi:hypothetical protein